MRGGTVTIVRDEVNEEVLLDPPLPCLSRSEERRTQPMSEEVKEEGKRSGVECEISSQQGVVLST
jgi:hypothetical protein